MSLRKLLVTPNLDSWEYIFYRSNIWSRRVNLKVKRIIRTNKRVSKAFAASISANTVTSPLAYEVSPEWRTSAQRTLSSQ